MTGGNASRDPIFTVCLAIFVVAAIIAVGAFLNNEFVATGDEKASTGDTVSVNYTGTYYDEYGGEHAVVFDTSYSSIANDDDIAKSNDFTKKDSYKALSFQIGKKTMLEKFENSVIGHKVGDKYKIELAAVDGYVGAYKTGILKMTDNEMSATVTVPYDEFHTVYPDVSFNKLTDGYTVVFESKYKWNATATITDLGQKVVVSYMPVVGEQYKVYESGSTNVVYTIKKVESDTIVCDIAVNDPTYVDNSGNIEMIKLDLGREPMYLTSISGTDINYKQGIDAERVNQPLFFEIEVVSIS